MQWHLKGPLKSDTGPESPEELDTGQELLREKHWHQKGPPSKIKHWHQKGPLSCDTGMESPGVNDTGLKSPGEFNIGPETPGEKHCHQKGRLAMIKHWHQKGPLACDIGPKLPK